MHVERTYLSFTLVRYIILAFLLIFKFVMYAVVRKISLVLVGHSLACACAFADQTSFGIADFIAEARNKKLAKKYIDGAKITDVRRKDMLTKDGLPFGVEYEIDFSVSYPFEYHGASGASDRIFAWPILHQRNDDSGKRVDFSSAVINEEKYMPNGTLYDEINPKKGNYLVRYYLVPDLLGINKNKELCIMRWAHRFLYPGYKNIPKTSHDDAMKYIVDSCQVESRHVGSITFDIQLPDEGKVLYESKKEVFNGNACTYLINFLKSNPPLCD